MKTLLHLTAEATYRWPDVEMVDTLLACPASAITGAQTPGSLQP